MIITIKAMPGFTLVGLFSLLNQSLFISLNVTYETPVPFTLRKKFDILGSLIAPIKQTYLPRLLD